MGPRFPGDHNFNKLESTLFEDASIHVTGQMFSVVGNKKNLLIFLCKI